MNILYNRLERIISEYDHDAIEYHIAKVMLDNIYKIKDIAIGEMASLCSVSKSTMSKFVRDMGFDDYKDFRLTALDMHKKEVYGSERTNMNITDFILQKGEQAYLSILKQDLDRFFNVADLEKLDCLAKKIHDYEKVAAFGDLYSETAARNLQYKMGYYRKTIYVTRSDKKQSDYIECADENTLLIVFSNQGNYIKRHQTMEGLPEKNCFNHTKGCVVLITSNKEMESDSRVDDCILYEHTTIVQNHVIIYQIIIELIAAAYQKKFGFPKEVKNIHTK